MSPTPDPFDELAALFLTDAPAPDAASVPRTLIEILVVGHLPVRGDLWLSPYADSIAREGGPVALLRLGGEGCWLQVVRPAEGTVVPAAGTTLRGAIRSLAGDVKRWAIRPPAGASPQDLLEAGAGRITILSSVDELARVRAFERAKTFVSVARDLGLPAPPLALCVIGADPQTAQQVRRRLEQTAEASGLGVPIPLVACLSRIDADIRSGDWVPLAEGDAPLASIAVWIREAAAVRGTPMGPAVAAAIHEVAPSGAAHSVAAVAPLRDGAPGVQEASRRGQEDSLRAQERRRAQEQDLVEAGGSWGFAQAPAAAPEETPRVPPPRLVDHLDLVEAREEGPTAREAAAAARVPPKPAVEMEPKGGAVPREPDERGAPAVLATYVEGLLALPVRCPGHERLELAVDCSGRIHVLGCEECLREIYAVRAWATAHRELIALACREHWIDPAAGTVPHVFTDTPARLADLQGTELRLHVLAPVVVEGRRGWYSAPLNAVVH